MKKFNVCCVDIRRHMEMILEDASYNEACLYLDSYGIKVNKIVTDSRRNKYVFVTNKGIFLYDETRGVLVRD